MFLVFLYMVMLKFFLFQKLFVFNQYFFMELLSQQQNNQVSYIIIILVCFVFIYVILQYMVFGKDLIWYFINFLSGFYKMNLFLFMEMFSKLEILFLLVMQLQLIYQLLQYYQQQVRYLIQVGVVGQYQQKLLILWSKQQDV